MLLWQLAFRPPLEDADVLTHLNFGKRIRYYRLKESEKANAIRNLIETWSLPENRNPGV
jgi:hypothetical protein